MAAEDPKITEAVGGAVQRSPRSFHGLLSDVTDMEPVLINTAEPRLSSAVLPGFHGNAAIQTSQAAALCIPAVLGPGSPLRSWGEEDSGDSWSIFKSQNKMQFGPVYSTLSQLSHKLVLPIYTGV